MPKISHYYLLLACLSKGMSQREIAKKAKISAGTFSKILNGRYKDIGNLSFNVIYRILEAIGEPLEAILMRPRKQYPPMKKNEDGTTSITLGEILRDVREKEPFEAHTTAKGKANLALFEKIVKRVYKKGIPDPA